MEDLYKLLGVPEESSQEQIKKAFRKAAFKHHPDRGGDTGLFQKINEAYQVLGDSEKRRTYNIQRRNPLMRGLHGGVGAAGDPEDFIKMFFGGGIPFGFPNGVGQMHVFHNGRPVNINRVMKPAPIVKTVNITLEEAYRGINVPLEIERWVQMENERRMETERLYVKIPMGTDDNEMIVIGGKGNIVDDTVKGDIKIFIRVANTTSFLRNGLDLLYKKKITLKEALVGFSFDLKHISGKTYAIQNTNGKIVTAEYSKVIPYMGMRREQKHPASPMVGNLVITFEVKYPANLTAKQREQLSDIL